jgi:HAD superfamily hydrolase (TIGR01490 family)
VNKSIVAAFDFDHTLIDRDSLLPFLFYAQGSIKASAKLISLIPDFIRYLIRRLSRQEIKERILTCFFKGWNYSDLEELGREYAADVLDRYVKKEALQKLRWHQTQGHRCILVSASPNFYLSPWAGRHGFETVLSSVLQTDPQSHVTGHLIGINCWGPEKVRRLLDYLGPREGFHLYAYGDSRGDSELLAIADFPFYQSF